MRPQILLLFLCLVFRIFFLVFSPTPRVRWVRMDATMPERNEQTSFGQELTIRDTDFSDSGHYQCHATNTESGLPVVRDFKLSVNCQ